MLFHGELQLADDAESRLQVTLTMEPDSLSLATGEEKLGTWNRPEAKAVEIARGRYDLTLGNETLIFTPENGPLFASRGLPYFSEPPPDSVEPAGFLAKIKKWGVRPTDFGTQLASTDGGNETSGESSGRPVGPLDAAVSGQTHNETPAEPAPSLQAAYADAVRGAASSVSASPGRPIVARSAAPIAVPAPAPPKAEVPSRLADSPRPASQPTPIAGPLTAKTADPVSPAPPAAPPPTVPRQDPPRPDTARQDVPDRDRERQQTARPDTGATIHMTTEVPPAASATPTASIGIPSRQDPPRGGSSAPQLPDVTGLLARLDAALRELQDGRMEPDRGRAMAEVVRAMCRAIEVSGGGAKDLNSIADKLDDGGGLGNNAIEDRT